MEEQLELLPAAIDEARDIIYGDREKTYGSPARNLTAVATMWQAYLSVLLDKTGDIHLLPEDVCAMMALLKTARFANDPTHRDNSVDAIGYWALIERCRTPAENPDNA